MVVSLPISVERSVVLSRHGVFRHWCWRCGICCASCVDKVAVITVTAPPVVTVVVRVDESAAQRVLEQRQERDPQPEPSPLLMKPVVVQRRRRWPQECCIKQISVATLAKAVQKRAAPEQRA